MIIGSFDYDKKNDTFLGDIVTLNFSVCSVGFKPVERRGDKDPDYRITAPTFSGFVELGAGWKRTSDKGKTFVSVALDSPLLPVPLNAALFLDKDDKAASLVWSRPKGKARAKRIYDELKETA